MAKYGTMGERMDRLVANFTEYMEIHIPLTGDEMRLLTVIFQQNDWLGFHIKADYPISHALRELVGSLTEDNMGEVDKVASSAE